MDEDARTAIKDLFVAVDHLLKYVEFRCPPTPGDKYLSVAKAAADAAYNTLNR